MRNPALLNRRRVTLFLGLVLLLVGCASRASFDGTRALAHVAAQCDLGPRIPGSEGARQAVTYIVDSLDDEGLDTEVHQFVYCGVTLRNVLAKMAVGRGPIVLLGAHYDTRRYADLDPVGPRAPVPGGNDGASGVAVLLELARCLDTKLLTNEIWLAFFDAEDQGGIGAWPWSVGASQMASNLSERPAYVIIVDMIGDTDQVFYWEANSDVDLQRHIWGIAADLGFQRNFVPSTKSSVIDDHIPFIEQGLVAIDIIDLDYPFWHTTQDTADKVSAESLSRVGVVLETLLEANPYK